MKETSLGGSAARNFLSRGQNIRAEISLMAKSYPESNYRFLNIQYNKKQFREEFCYWIIYHPNNKILL